jgi:predicted MFS family arabinose efflux permease
VRLQDRISQWLGAFRIAGANRRLLLVQLARLASVTGRWAYTITLAVFAYQAAGAKGVAAAGIVRLVPGAAAAPFAGALVRRIRIERLLLGGGVLRTLALAGAGIAVLADSPAWAVYAFVAVESAVSTLMRPFQNSLLPELSRTPQELTSTNLALSVIESGGVFLGPLIGASLLHGTSVGIVFLASAAAYLASTLLLLPIRVPSQQVETEVRRAGLLADAATGVRAVASDPDTRVVVLLYGAQNLVAGALGVLIVVVAMTLLDMGESGVGTLTAAVGLGGVVGGVLVFSRLRRGQHGADLWFGLLLCGAPLVLLAVLSSRIAAFALLGLVGIGVTVVDVAAVTLLQRAAAGELLPHALGTLQAVFVASVAAGTLLAPALVATLGARGALLVTGAFLPVLALGLSRRLRRLDRRRATNPSLVALLAANPIFAPLADPLIEHLAASLRPVTAAPQAVVFAQGDDGDAFYVIERGEVEVLVDGVRVRTLGPGESFGEIALLRSVPRTATICATSAVDLQRLDRGRFLGTVAANRASGEAADAVVGARLGLRSGFASV